MLMTTIEEKSLRTQLELLSQIERCSDMIIYLMQKTAENVLKSVIQPHMYIKDGQTTVELTVDDFTELRVALVRLASDAGLREINSYIESSYLTPRIENKKILKMLQ